jgi:SPP1 family predicted phage head-tail adaptor
MVHAGQLDKVIELVAITTQDDDLGNPQKISEVAQKTRAKVDYLAGGLFGKEIDAGNQIQADVEVMFTIRYMTGVNTEQIIRYQGTEFDIRPPIAEIQGRRRFLQIPARSRHYGGPDVNA